MRNTGSSESEFLEEEVDSWLLLVIGLWSVVSIIYEKWVNDI
jgi:hypothetical protein